MRLPAGNQAEVLATLHRDELTAAELDGVVDLLAAAQRPLAAGVHPGPATTGLAASAAAGRGWAWDPRLSRAGNRVARRLTRVLDGLGRMETWLHQSGPRRPDALRSLVLTPAFTRLARDAHSVATLDRRPDRGVSHS